MSRRSSPTVLVTNDDGPPAHDSPFVQSFVRALRTQLGWSDIRVVLPSSQKSWIGKAYQIKDTIRLSEARYPSENGKDEDEDEAPWILLDGTPATCANIGLHNLYPGEIDLVLSGPNFGRNTSSAFALSSGTIGAALSASMSGVPAVAVSYGIFDKKIPEGCVDRANEIACTVIHKLWHDVFADHHHLADVYNVNVPLVPEILEQPRSSPKVAWTTLNKNSYGRLFAAVDEDQHHHQASGTSGGSSSVGAISKDQKKAQEGGPAAVPVRTDPSSSSSNGTSSKPQPDDSAVAKSSSNDGKALPRAFKFKPEMGSLVNPDVSTLQPGTDIHAIHSGWCSVTPLRATFAPGEFSDRIETEDGSGKGLWKL